MEEKLLKDIARGKLPQHVAIIMDGNGRWAQGRGLGRTAGHRAGVETVRMVIETSIKLGIKFLTLFAFSTENQRRPGKEVKALLAILKHFLQTERKNLIKNKIRLKVIGDIEWFPESISREIKKTLSITEGNSSFTLILALNYGARQEIVRACQRIVTDIQQQRLSPSALNEEVFSRYLYTSDIPDPDLLIRTSNEYRISNFLLWQLSYAELWITPVLWPDFSKNDFLKALISYQNRQRRFGMVNHNA